MHCGWMHSPVLRCIARRIIDPGHEVNHEYHPHLAFVDLDDVFLECAENIVPSRIDFGRREPRRAGATSRDQGRLGCGRRADLPNPRVGIVVAQRGRRGYRQGMHCRAARRINPVVTCLSDAPTEDELTSGERAQVNARQRLR